MFSIPSWAGAAISATSFAFTAKSSTASAAAHDRRRFEIFSCADRRSSCTFATSWTYGNGRLDIQQGIEDDHTPLCLGGRGAPPPEHCGGPRGYRLMLKRNRRAVRLLIRHRSKRPSGCWLGRIRISQPEHGICCARLSMKDGEALSDDWNNTGLWNRIALASRRPTSGCRCSWRAGDSGHEVPESK